MGCNCNAELTLSECDLMIMYANDPNKGVFIYFIGKEGLKFAKVRKGETPNDAAIRSNFINDSGQIEWFSVKEHPCGQIKRK